MKFFHLADLHLGIRVCEFSLLEDQAYLLEGVLEEAKKQKPDAVLLAGDLYDRLTPPVEAVRLFGRFVSDLSDLGIKVFLIPGNHDSGDRMSFCASLIEKSGVYIAGEYRAPLEPVVLHDPFGTVEVFLLPFVRPADVRRVYPDETIETYTDAVRTALSGAQGEEGARRVLLSHQFVTAGASDLVAVGGTDNVDLSVYHGFSYVALGHIHTARTFPDGRVRYAGAPLAYTFGEVGTVKSFTVCDLDAEGNVTLSECPVRPLRPMRELRGTFASLLARDADTDAYYRVTLTDEEDVPEALAELRHRFPYIMQLVYDNTRTRAATALSFEEDLPVRDPLTLFSEFYELQNGQPMSAEAERVLRAMIGEVFDR